MKIWKLIFNLLILASIKSAWASEMVLITYQKDSPLIQTMETVLTRDFYIPQELIKKVQTEFECESYETAILHLCLTNDQEMKVVDFDKKKVKEVLGVFYAK